MKKWYGVLGVLGLCLFLLNPNAVLEGAAKGLQVCIQTVIPSLFPFFIFSSMLSGSIQGRSMPLIRPLGRLCGIPQGSESVVLLGCCGGYPVGAKSLYALYAAGAIGKQDAQRMLSFCSNAGPSFIFGISASLFQSKAVPWFLWGIQILSMLLTAAILPNKSNSPCTAGCRQKVHPMEQAIRAMATVCGWILFMGAIQQLITVYFPLPDVYGRILTGILEISSGCVALSGFADPAMQYILMGIYLSFGGICVILQTKSLIGDLNIRYYISGKLKQTVFSSALLFLSVPILFPGNSCMAESIICCILSLILCIHYQMKNNAGIYRTNAV